MADEHNNPNAGGDDAAKAAEKAAQDSKPGKLSFTPEQQDVIDTLIDRMYGKGYDKSKAEYEPKVSELSTKLQESQSVIERLNQQLESVKSGAKDEKGDKADKADKADKGKKPEESEAMKQFHAQIEELRAAQKALQTERDEARKALQEQEVKQRGNKLKDEFLEAAREIGFIDTTEVFKLLRDELKIDDETGQVVVMNPKTGRPRMDSTLENPLTLSDYLSQFATERKHLVRASDAGGGTGAGESRRLDVKRKSDKVDFAAMTPAEFEAFKNKVKSNV